jgi:hypothetical protein
MNIYKLYDWVGKVMETLDEDKANSWILKKPYLANGRVNHCYKVGIKRTSAATKV